MLMRHRNRKVRKNHEAYAKKLANAAQETYREALEAERTTLAKRAALLPDSLLGTLISSLEVGAEAFVAHYVMEVDAEGRCWINTDYFIESSGITTGLHIVRTEHGFDVFYDRSFKYKWCRSHGSLTGSYLPVTKLYVQ